MDDANCLFVILASMLTLIMPGAAQPLLAALAAGLVAAATVTPRPARPTTPHRPQQRGVLGP
jgi:hypothetical protein